MPCWTALTLASFFGRRYFSGTDGSKLTVCFTGSAGDALFTGGEDGELGGEDGGEAGLEVEDIFLLF